MILRALPLLVLTALAGCQDPPQTAPTDASDVAVMDASPPDAALVDTAPPPEAGGRCSFNAHCAAGLRCECSLSGGCHCLPGTRGTGVNGVDACTSGNDCASALCLDGPSGMLCSDACRSDTDCPSALPRCLSVATVGSFCARTPPGADAGITDAPAGCTGTCARTTLAGTFGARRGGFDTAYHGATGTDGIYVEAYAGAAAGCPSMTSPTPLRTLALGGLHGLAAGVAQTDADGVTAVLFDFSGDLVPTPLVRATAVRVVPRAVARGEYVSLEVTATFAAGTITGGLFAPHCASLD